MGWKSLAALCILTACVSTPKSRNAGVQYIPRHPIILHVTEKRTGIEEYFYDNDADLRTVEEYVQLQHTKDGNTVITHEVMDGVTPQYPGVATVMVSMKGKDQEYQIFLNAPFAASVKAKYDIEFK